MADESKIREFTLRPPPGTRFYVWGSDCRLQFQRGREREVVQWLRTWIDAYLEPEALKSEAIMRAQQNDADEVSNPRIAQPATPQPANPRRIAPQTIKELAESFFKDLESKSVNATQPTSDIQPEVNTDNGDSQDHG